ncbi:MAG: hypothetical protein LBR68_06140, partial [Lachnoclostridium sp.]|nr:hypothetical protein [Lachnoclostridium sp.]
MTDTKTENTTESTTCRLNANLDKTEHDMKVDKKKKRQVQERHLLPFLETRLRKLPSLSLNERDSKYAVLDDGDRLKNKNTERENQYNHGRKKSKTEKRKARIAKANQPKLASFFKKPSEQTPSTPSVRIVREHIETYNEKEYTVQWDNVTFEDRYLVIRGVVPRRSIDLFFKPAQASFNLIKRRIKQQLQPFKIQVTGDQVRLLDNIYIGEVVEYMECKDALDKMLESGLPDYRGYYDRIPSRLSALFFPKDKREYLDILCDLQSDNRKIVPVAEIMGDTVEDSFLFTIERGEVIYIIWENTNLSRATYVFR